ncbi:hypothetical protein [Bernardetia sp. MNP-M8]|uniref:hypothetical protein n=1 Tax=Bernardetia sp. MNP-M8 TaxID=3127470 RepID=UPI0030CFE940
MPNITYYFNNIDLLISITKQDIDEEARKNFKKEDPNRIIKLYRLTSHNTYKVEFSLEFHSIDDIHPISRVDDYEPNKEIEIPEGSGEFYFTTCVKDDDKIKPLLRNENLYKCRNFIRDQYIENEPTNSTLAFQIKMQEIGYFGAKKRDSPLSKPYEIISNRHGVYALGLTYIHIDKNMLLKLVEDIVKEWKSVSDTFLNGYTEQP